MSSKRGLFFILIGPAGAGKSTVAQHLVSQSPVVIRTSISATSREPRSGEVDGEDYLFLTREKFEQQIKDDKFFEWEETHGNYYGTPQEQIDFVLHEQGVLLLDIDVRGAITFSERYPDNAFLVLLIPPSGEQLIDRLKKRGGLEDGELETRLNTALREFDDFEEAITSGSISGVVVNDDLGVTTGAVGEMLQRAVAGDTSEEMSDALERIALLRDDVKRFGEE